MITTIIFSKNRPLQLDLCLQSINKRFNTGEKHDVVVIYKCDDEYKPAYLELEQEYRAKRDTYEVSHLVYFWEQSESLFADVKLALTTTDNEFVCCLTDDSFFHRKTPLISAELLHAIFVKQEKGFSKARSVCSISLRLGLNINKRGVPVNLEGKKWIPDHLFWAKDLNILKVEDSDFIVYDRTQHFLNSYWNFPLTLDGSIFVKQDFLEWVSELHYLEPFKKWKQNPNELECGLQRFINLARAFVVFPEISCVVNSPNNMVQSTHLNNKAGEDFPVDPKHLLEIFNSGGRIDLESIPETEINCPHTEIDILQGLIND